MSDDVPRIAINAHLLHGQGGYRSAGIHTYIEQTLRHLPEADPNLRLTVFTSHPPAELAASIDLRVSRLPTARPGIRILWEQLVQPYAVRRARVDLLHDAAFVAPLLRPCPIVITVYDLSFALFPQYFRGFNQAYLRLGTRASLKHARRVIAISNHTRDDIARLYGLPHNRIDVAYPGVDPALSPRPADEVDRFRHEKQLPDKFLLFLGTLEPRKNLVMLVRAFVQMKARCPDARLVLAGGVGWLAEEISNAVKLSGVADSILLPGYVPAGDQALWYAAATAFVYPSKYEGFGLPPLEAMACGAPVIASNAASLPEVVGGAGLSIDPDDVGGWAEAMARLWKDSSLRAELRDRGLEQSRRFTWGETARQIALTYRRAIEHQHGTA